ncbi:phospholipase A2 inhibitor and Ly6/PLAUR domain-containing protein-like [Aquarana catesbeiana]|uniref:phospholipase A2 inhibitor and Ly6/PLAUR domain-containing protein-like n=1 Tax=Aquarana catesbeiana TaxID=8400 RepID=UPI003CC9987B
MESALLVKLLLFLFVQAIVPAHSTICYVCEGPNSESCTHKEEQCPDGDRCMITSEQFVADNKEYRSILKRCARNLPCDVVIHGHAGSDLYIKSSLKCCKGDRCNTAMYEMPKNVTKERKGIVCPICREYNTLDGCNATRYTVCWEEKDLCTKFRGTLQKPDGVQYNISAQGCSSPLACTYDYSEMASLKVINAIESVCYIPKGPPPS